MDLINLGKNTSEFKDAIKRKLWKIEKLVSTEAERIRKRVSNAHYLHRLLEV